MKKHILTFLISCISLMAVAQNGLVAVTPVTTVKDGELYIYTFSTKSYNTSIAYGTLKVTSTDLKIFSSLPSGSNNSISIRFSGNNITTPKTGTLTFTAKYINNGSTQEYDLPPLNISVTIHPPTVIPPVTRPVNDDYAGAVLLNPGNNTTCIQQVNGTTVNATQSAQSVPACAGGVNDDVWYKFVAIDNIHAITLSDISHIGPATGGINTLMMAMYNSALELLDCSLVGVIAKNQLVAGQTYYLRIWTSSQASDINATFKICITRPLDNVIKRILSESRSVPYGEQLTINADFLQDPLIPVSDITFEWELSALDTYPNHGFYLYNPYTSTYSSHFLSAPSQIKIGTDMGDDFVKVKVRMRRVSTNSIISDWFITPLPFYSY